VTLGIRSLSILATILTESVLASPICMLPPIVTLPVTSKLPAILTLFCKLISSLAESILTSPAKLSIVLPLTLMLPVCTLLLSIIVTLPAPSSNVMPPVKLILELEN
jgi:hypothetical protein